ncbi:Uncharacterized protein APZ42_018532 [Daphnia magna]|uniref:Uncharacterized protein n=1 Tax=Daphnia magna TaxID=35525 RepID=A0A162CQH2_9CRUS|nr:Uncharacterized protein APZ42_018532 [Daphnia magna]
MSCSHHFQYQRTSGASWWTYIREIGWILPLEKNPSAFSRQQVFARVTLLVPLFLTWLPNPSMKKSNLNLLRYFHVKVCM